MWGLSSGAGLPSISWVVCACRAGIAATGCMGPAHGEYPAWGEIVVCVFLLQSTFIDCSWTEAVSKWKRAPSCLKNLAGLGREVEGRSSCFWCLPCSTSQGAKFQQVISFLDCWPLFPVEVGKWAGFFWATECQHFPWHRIYEIAQSIQRRQRCFLAERARMGLACLLPDMKDIAKANCAFWNLDRLKL